MFEDNGSVDRIPKEANIPTIRSPDQIRPLHDMVVIQLITEEYTESGLVLPRTDETETAARGKVVAVGPGRASEFDQQLCPMSVGVGDVVYITSLPTFSTASFLCGSEILICVRDRELTIAVKPV